MKKFVTLSILFTLALHAAAQYDMSIWMNGSNTTYTTSEVDSITFIIKDSTPDPEPEPDPEPTPDPEPVIGTYYITGNDALLSENVWLADAILMTKEGNVVTHTFRSVPAGSYCQFKITIGDWSQNWGYYSVTNPPAGVSTDGDENVVFTMATTSDVKVTFDGTNISLTGDFVGGSTPTPDPEPEPEPIKEITIKAQVPASWSNTITAWVWPTGGEGREVVPTKEDNWYVVTETCPELNIIFKNGISWNGDNNQTVDMTFTENTCVAITAGASKATYTVVDCNGSTTPEPEPEPIIGPYYIAGNAALVGEDLAWKADAIQMNQQGNLFTYTFSNLPADKDFQFKITIGTWDKNWGFTSIKDVPVGVSGSDSGNVAFKLIRRGDVTVTFDGNNISLTGNFRSW